MTGSQGNINLEQQLSYYNWLKFSKQYENDYLSVKIFRQSISNLITNVYKQQNELLIKTLDNISSYSLTGLDFDFQTKLFEKVEININTNLNYNYFKVNDNSFLIRKNSGLGLNSLVDITTNIFKDKIALSFSGIYNGPEYSLLSTTRTYPFLDFNANTNVLKNKVKISIYFRNLLGENATKIENRTFSDNFNQFSVSRNNLTNISFSIIYNFGKYFDNYKKDENIQINDIRK